VTASSEGSVPRAHIAKVVRTLRRERAWTQAELAGKLGLSQSRLSEIESGAGSFTAEQFLLILRLFNVTTSHFTGAGSDRALQLQNALARLGAHHLQESTEVPPSEELDDAMDVVRNTLVQGDPRLTTALASVLVSNIDRVSLGKLYLDLGKVGAERRLGWVCENTAAAVTIALRGESPRAWAQRARRAAAVLGSFLESVPSDVGTASTGAIPDALDPSIRSKKTLAEIREASSAISRKWGIVSSLTVQDFAQSLRAARVAHP
jgi:transcriptional regulator with XRE-family HTH domain